ncbi:hypothetical protein [Novosphingobium sp.]|uniref:hypothetical protein n=1 Tax=Novosphingobium sp. TaxID=1874826 RepID=UPI0035658A0C
MDLENLIIAQFSSILFGEIGKCLLRITADVDDKVLKVRFLVRESTSDEELERYSVCCTELISHHGNLIIDEEYIKVEGVDHFNRISDLPLKIFSIHLGDL